MEIAAFAATVLGIVTGLWFLWDKFAGAVRKKSAGLNGYPIKALVLERTPLFRSGERIELGKQTAIVGGLGKTAITEWLSVLCDTAKLARWMALPKSLPIVYTVETNGDPGAVRISIRQHEVTYSVHGDSVSSSPFPLKVFFVEMKRFCSDGLDDAEIISTHLGIPIVTLKNYASLVGKASFYSISEIEFRSREAGVDVYVDIGGGVKRRYCLLSGSEQGRVLTELGIAAAQFTSRNTPTVLVIECNSIGFDDARINMYLQFLSDADPGFQIIMVSHDVDRDWKSWDVVELIGDAPLTEITVGPSKSPRTSPSSALPQ